MTYSGLISVNDRFIWEPNNPRARVEIVVSKIGTNQDGETWIQARTQNGQFWNEESRFRESVEPIVEGQPSAKIVGQVSVEKDGQPGRKPVVPGWRPERKVVDDGDCVMFDSSGAQAKFGINAKKADGCEAFIEFMRMRVHVDLDPKQIDAIREWIGQILGIPDVSAQVLGMLNRIKFDDMHGEYSDDGEIIGHRTEVNTDDLIRLALAVGGKAEDLINLKKKRQMN